VALGGQLNHAMSRNCLFCMDVYCNSLTVLDIFSFFLYPFVLMGTFYCLVSSSLVFHLCLALLTFTLFHYRSYWLCCLWQGIYSLCFFLMLPVQSRFTTTLFMSPTSLTPIGDVAHGGKVAFSLKNLFMAIMIVVLFIILFIFWMFAIVFTSSARCWWSFTELFIGELLKFLALYPNFGLCGSLAQICVARIKVLGWPRCWWAFIAIWFGSCSNSNVWILLLPPGFHLTLTCDVRTHVLRLPCLC